MERNYYAYIAVFFTIAITVGSLISMKNITTPSIHFFDKILHSSAYFFLALSWLFTFKINRKSIKYSVVTVFVVFIYGIIIEVLQATLTTYRQADVYDMLANLVGISVSLLFFSAVFQKKSMN